jgi:hypothetical protein
MAPRSENEKYFQDPITKSRKQFPSLTDPSSKYLSVIIPAYKEVDRCKSIKAFFYSIHFCIFSTSDDERYNELFRRTSSK